MQGMDESYFTFTLFCRSLCKDNGRSHLVISGGIKEPPSATKPFLSGAPHSFPDVASNHADANELLWEGYSGCSRNVSEARAAA